MKITLFLIMALLFSSFVPVVVEPVKFDIALVLGLLVGFWEVIARLIPSVGQLGFIGKLIEILAWLSDFFNRKKK